MSVLVFFCVLSYFVSSMFMSVLSMVVFLSVRVKMQNIFSFASYSLGVSPSVLPLP